MKNWKKFTALTAVFGALAIFAGCTSASALSVEEAKDLVKDQVGKENAVVVHQETDREDGVYELQIVVDGTAYEFEVDSSTGQVREVEREEARPADAAVPAETKPASITLEEARAIAYGHAGVQESQALDKSHERDDGVFEIDFEYEGLEYDYEIGPDGTILKVEKEPEPTAPKSAETQPKETQPIETQPKETSSGRITLEEAKAIAYSHAGVSESDAYDKSYESDDGRYEIDFDCGGYEYEYDISCEGRILSSHKEKDHDHHSHRTTPAETQPRETQPAETQPKETQPREEKKSGRISAEKALSIALSHAGVSDARDKDVEWDDGRWEVSFDSGRTEYEYHISAEGKILRWEKEHDD